MVFIFKKKVLGKEVVKNMSFNYYINMSKNV